MSLEELVVLLVDDDDLDREMVVRALRRSGLGFDIIEAQNGLEALDYLRGANGKQRIRDPYIILLDINMPRMGGFDFLEVLRQDDELSDAIVFMLTTSDHDEDIDKAYKLNIAGYVVKDQVGRDFVQLTEMLTFYKKIVKFRAK